MKKCLYHVGGMSGSVLYSSLRNKSFRGAKINSSINNNIYKDLPLAIKEWKNNIYNYNTKKIVHLNWWNGLVRKLINSFLNGKKYNKKAFVSKLELKHIIDKVIITYHIFNQKKDLLWKENNFLNNLINLIYNKEVVFRVVRLKYPYLNASILVDYIVNRINSGKIRLLRSYRRIIKKTRLYKLNNNNINLRELGNISKESLLNIELPVYCSAIGRFIKNIKLNGIIIEVAGRLTRRRSAARSLTKKGQKGSIKNIYPSIPLIGYVRSNLEYNESNSQTLNGSYNVRSVISSVSY